MYRPNQSSASGRANAEFLRRMTSGDCGCELPTRPVFNPQQGTIGGTVPCPTMPSLAMVYSPVQSWSNRFDSPSKALSEGSLFKDLIKPFEGCRRGR